MGKGQFSESRRHVLKAGVAGAGALALGPSVLAACGSSGGSKAAPGTTSAKVATDAIADNDLLLAAQKEGQLNLIAIPEGEGSVYQHLVQYFRDYSKIDVKVELPDATSAMEMQTISERKGKPNQPDVVDVGVSYAVDGSDSGALTSIRPALWDDVPTNAKDPSGRWVSTYYGLISFVTVSSFEGDAPKTFADLRNLPHTKPLWISGDPRSKVDADETGKFPSALAFGSVWAAALANGGSLDDIGPGVDFFAELAADGIFSPDQTIAIVSTIATGTLPVSIVLNYNIKAAQALIAKNKPDLSLTLSIPEDGLFPNFYAQAAVADSPNPNAAKLWLDYLLSDVGATRFLEGGALPIRFPTMVERGKIPADLLKDLPDADKLAKVAIPTLAQVAKAREVIDERWRREVVSK